MAIATCPKCRFEFIAGEAPDEPERCPACGERFILAMAFQAGGPIAAEGHASSWPGRGRTRRSGSLQGRLAVLGIALAIWLGLLADIAAGGGTMLHWLADPDARPGRVVATPLLLGGFLGHAILSLLALLHLCSGPRRTVLLLRMGLGCWLVLGGAGLAMGAGFWPADPPDRPVALMVGAGGALVVLLGYLATLEWLADRVVFGATSAGQARPAIRITAVVLLIVNAALTAGVAVTAVAAMRRGPEMAALLGCLAGGALGLYLLWSIGGLLRLESSPAESAIALPRAVMALLAAAVTLLMASFAGLIWPAVPPAAAAAVLIADVLAVWYCHARLAPPKPT